ncbi:MAG: biotin--[acetyl-CoA-carboxylase] ligase family protein [Candidatus Ancillula sp.]|nr:biotin--[acetyl-CoA-carboxylase] ligase family protein [Candidatus Ancillula sp.]
MWYNNCVGKIDIIHYIDSVDSTNNEISRWVLEKKLELVNYTSLVAHEQLSGRGRGHHAWFSKPGKSLTMSTYIKIPNTHFWRTNISEVMLISATACLNALKTLVPKEQFDNLGFRIKKPNDIYIKNKKVAGILGELISSNYVDDPFIECVVGIGLNVALTEDELPFANATSLLIEGFEIMNFFEKFPKRYMKELSQYFN